VEKVNFILAPPFLKGGKGGKGEFYFGSTFF